MITAIDPKKLYYKLSDEPKVQEPKPTVANIDDEPKMDDGKMSDGKPDQSGGNKNQ